MKRLNFFSDILFGGKFRIFVLFVFDLLCFSLIDAGYYLLSGQTIYSVPTNNGLIYLENTVCLFVCLMVSRLLFKAYNNVWRYSNTKAYIFLTLSDFLGCTVFILLSRYVFYYLEHGFYIGIWHSVTVTSLFTLFTLVSRFAYRLIYKRFHIYDKRDKADNKKIRVGIIGAGQLGVYLSAELNDNHDSRYQPMCFIDIDKAKIGNRVAGLPVYSPGDAEKVIEKYSLTEVILAISDISSEKTERLWDRYSSLGCRVKIYALPFHDEDNAHNKSKRVIRDFSIEDLLFREPLNINRQSELDFYKGKTVLVTGGGGSIGSELCRQISKCSPKQLIIFDIYENNAYDIQQELKYHYGMGLNLAVEIGSVRDLERLDCVFKNYKPDIVFHAAAHKHVPLMEHSSSEAVKNNVIGTYNTANVAEKYGAEKFILISTDKAVNPTNVMGASKRVCEMIVQCRADSNTSFAAVRFGNVLGSNGSVVPLLKKQIASGGPVTITDKRIIRYFMTIPEASQLVMLAGAKAEKGELFVLDMGLPVKIYDLAVNMIRLMGYIPEKEIEIKEVGLRPGEKLYEELLMKGENLVETENKTIFIEKDKPYTRSEVDSKLKVLADAVRASSGELDSPAVKEALKKIVPTFVEPGDINCRENIKEILDENALAAKA